MSCVCGMPFLRGSTLVKVPMLHAGTVAIWPQMFESEVEHETNKQLSQLKLYKCFSSDVMQDILPHQIWHTGCEKPILPVMVTVAESPNTAELWSAPTNTNHQSGHITGFFKDFQVPNNFFSGPFSYIDFSTATQKIGMAPKQYSLKQAWSWRGAGVVQWTVTQRHGVRFLMGTV